MPTPPTLIYALASACRLGSSRLRAMPASPTLLPTLLSTLAKVLREVEAGRYHGVACAAAALEAARPAPGNDCRMEYDDLWRALQTAVAYAEEVSCDSEG